MRLQARKDLAGLKVGNLTVIEYSHSKGHAYWRCKCDCGNEVVVASNKLTGKTPVISCGCAKKSNLTGQRFNRLVVLGPTGKKKNGNYTWLCKCDCGEEVEVMGSRLTNGATQSCGCLNWDNRNTHGMTNTPLHHVWSSAKRRCEKENHHAYKNYGARGIYMCDEWRENFLAFYDWARANGYQEGLSLDRINNDGPYSPENCRWATPKEQINNSRLARLFTIDDKTLCIKDWAEYCNIPYHVLLRQLRGKEYDESIIILKNVLKGK